MDRRLRAFPPVHRRDLEPDPRHKPHWHLVSVQESARAMVRQGIGGAIAITASTNAFQPEAGGLAYNTSKSGQVAVMHTAVWPATSRWPSARLPGRPLISHPHGSPRLPRPCHTWSLVVQSSAAAAAAARASSSTSSMTTPAPSAANTPPPLVQCPGPLRSPNTPAGEPALQADHRSNPPCPGPRGITGQMSTTLSSSTT